MIYISELEIVPKHIAIIPDGNRRWAEKKGVDKKEGYATGIRHIGDVLKWCKECGVPMLSMWGFSTDNMKRDASEVATLFDLFRKNLQEAINSDDKNKSELRVRFFGRVSVFPQEIQYMMKKAEEITAGKERKYQLNLLLGYGGREELVDAINTLLKKGVKEVNEKMVSENLYTKDIPDPDLIIRTSGEQRLSGLFPWQSCYSEFYFEEKLWPDFSKDDFVKALNEYSKRKRRYGK